MVKYKIKKIFNGLYAIEIPDSYQRAMLFLRSQEYYESKFPEIYRKDFDVFHFMELYRKWRNSDHFSYPEDWSGFNVPSHIIESCIGGIFRSSSEFKPTPYDYVMSNIITSVREEIGPDSKYYLIGVDKFKGKVMNHEIAHGLYYIDPGYKQECLKLIENLNESVYKELSSIISKMGYSKDVIDDEIQAYLSTEIYGPMSKIPKIISIAKKFRKNFKKYKKTHGLNT